jgi:thymidylate synthase ThyX
MTVRVEMITDSVGEHAPRLSTILMYYPHVIHAELMTHRVFSRNAASSRAIPVKKMIQAVLDDPYIPPKWYKNEPGMQGTAELTGYDLDMVKLYYYRAMKDAIRSAWDLSEAGAHKQIANRILNPFMHILVLVTATQWSNFLHVRDHKDAEPNMQLLGAAVRKCMDASKPTLRLPGQWHTPFVGPEDEGALVEFSTKAPLRGVSAARVQENALKLSVSRSASTSYKTVEGFDMTLERAVALHDKLVGGDPLHASPTEHQAKVDDLENPRAMVKRFMHPELSGNLAPGWIQYRKTLAGECR